MKTVNNYINEALIKKGTKINNDYNLGFTYDEFIKDIEQHYEIGKRYIIGYSHGLSNFSCTKNITDKFFQLIDINKDIDGNTDQKIIRNICVGLLTDEAKMINLYGSDLKMIYRDRINDIHLWKYNLWGADNAFSMIIIIDKYNKNYRIYKINEKEE